MSVGQWISRMPYANPLISRFLFLRAASPPCLASWSMALAQPGDILITKRQWGAFHGTELDLQLRRRGIQAIVLAGIATNIGVESTARQAWELGFSLII